MIGVRVIMPITGMNVVYPTSLCGTVTEKVYMVHNLQSRRFMAVDLFDASIYIINH